MMAVTPPELMRRVYRQMEIGKGIRLSAEEVDLLAEMGALKAMSAYTAGYVERQAGERQAALKVAREEALDATVARHPRHVASKQEVENAMRRARARLSPKGERP